MHFRLFETVDSHPYPAIYDLEEYPKGYVIPKFRVFSGEGNRDLNPK
jgi:hypothetical protein